MRKVIFEIEVKDDFIYTCYDGCPFGHEESSWSEDDGTDTYIVCNYSDKCPTLLDDGLVWYDYMKVSPKEDKPYMVKFKDEEYPQYCLYKEGGFGDYDDIVSMWAEVK